MTLLPFQLIDGKPNTSAAYLNALLVASLNHTDKSASDLYASMSGATLVDWFVGSLSLEPNHVIFRQGLEALIVMAGTTNVPQWVSHYGGSVIPILDPITGDTMLASVQGGAIPGLASVLENLGGVAASGGTLRLAGHSFGAGCAFAIATWLLYVSQAQTEVMTVGEPKVFGNLVALKQPNCHFRLIAATSGVSPTQPQVFDPVTQLPPGALQYMGFSSAFKLVATIFGLKFVRTGRTFTVNKAGVEEFQESALWSIPFVADFLLADQLVTGTQLHSVDGSYLPLLHKSWKDSGLNPELEAFEPFYSSYTGSPYSPPITYGQPLSYNTVNQALGLQSTPITPANASDWNNISSVGVLIPGYTGPGGESSMTLMRGSLLCGIMNQGFSETWHAASQGETYASMTAKMGAVMNGRAKLSQTVADPGSGSLNNRLSFTAIRISDDLLVRDVQVTQAVTPPGWGGTTGNMDGQQAARIIWRASSGAQIAATYLHGVPLFAVGGALGNETRTINWLTSYLTALQAYCGVIAAQGLGFNTINNNPANALGALSNPVYNVTTAYYTFTTANAVPQGKFRAALRGFKSFNFLNGRQSCQSTGMNTFIVLKKAPNATWDNTGTATPLSGYNNNVPFSNYVVVVPATASPELLCTKKLGRPFFLQRGRISRRAA